MQRSRPTLWLCARNEVSLFFFFFQSLLPHAQATFPPPPLPLLVIYWFDCKENNATVLSLLSPYRTSALNSPKQQNHRMFLILLHGFSRSPSTQMIPAAFSLSLSSHLHMFGFSKQNKKHIPHTRQGFAIEEKQRGLAMLFYARNKWSGMCYNALPPACIVVFFFLDLSLGYQHPCFFVLLLCPPLFSSLLTPLDPVSRTLLCLFVTFGLFNFWA